MSELSSSPVQVVTFTSNKIREKATPLMMEFPVERRLTPFLVSSSKSTLWIRRAHGGKVRAATRMVEDLTVYFKEVIDAIIVEGRASDWGNVHPLTKQGVQAAIDHVKSYDLEELEVLAHPEMAWGEIEPTWAIEDGSFPIVLMGLPIQSAPWLRKDTLLIIPRDRAFVGFVLLFEEHIASVIHNASRGVGIATTWEPPEPSP